MKLFGKNIEPSCEYCAHGAMLSNGEDVVCKKFGFIKSSVKCSKFKYDPLKRTPSKPNFNSDFSQSDFSIE